MHNKFTMNINQCIKQISSTIYGKKSLTCQRNKKMQQPVNLKGNKIIWLLQKHLSAPETGDKFNDVLSIIYFLLL